MPIVVNTINDKEYVVVGDYTLDQFRKKFMETHEDYIKFDAKAGRDVVPTYVMRGTIVAVQEFAERTTPRVHEKPQGW